jgi:hypothetical protein
MPLARVGAPFAMAWGRLVAREPLFTSESLHALRGNHHVISAKAAAELGHAPRPTFDSVRDVYSWFAEAGVIPARRRSLAA